ETTVGIESHHGKVIRAKEGRVPRHHNLPIRLHRHCLSSVRPCPPDNLHPITIKGRVERTSDSKSRINSIPSHSDQNEQQNKSCSSHNSTNPSLTFRAVHSASPGKERLFSRSPSAL